jgi:glycosyltransferase involved in cell wall biosynthesis
MGRPWLSVLMPIYNGGEYLSVALDSIIAQMSDDLEVIAVDDASTDNTPEILERYKNHLNLTVDRRERNRDWPAAVNRAMELACGEYECWLHHDDVWGPGRIEKLRESIERWPEAVLLLRSSRFIDPSGRQVGSWRCPLPANRLLEPETVVPRLLVQNFNAACAPAYKAHVAREVGKLDEQLWYTADWDFWLKMATAGKTVYCPEPLIGYRIHPTSMTSNRTSNPVKLRPQYDIVLERHLSAGPGSGERWRGAAEVARFSALVNIELARWAGGDAISFYRLAREFLRLGPWNGHRYLRDARIVERAWSRLRVRPQAKVKSLVPS